MSLRGSDELERDGVGLPASLWVDLTGPHRMAHSDDLAHAAGPPTTGIIAPASPRAKDSVFSSSSSRTRSIPFRSDISTRFTRTTGARIAQRMPERRHRHASNSGVRREGAPSVREPRYASAGSERPGFPQSEGTLDLDLPSIGLLDALLAWNFCCFCRTL